MYQTFPLGGGLGIESHFVPFISNPFTFGMTNVSASIPSSILVPSSNPSVGLGCTSSPFTTYQFGGGHIPPSTPFIEGWPPPTPAPHTSVHPIMGGGGYVNIGSTTYIPPFIPSSSTPIPSNVFLMMNTPHNSSRNLGGHGPFGMVPLSSGIFMSEGHMPPWVFRGHPLDQMGNFGNIVHPS